MRWVTFYYDLLSRNISDFKVHNNKEDALDYFNKHCKDYFQLNSRFKADKLPARYGYPTRSYNGISARAFKKMFDWSVDEVLEKLAETESEE